MCLNEAAMKAWDLKMHRSNCAWLCSGFLLYSLTETKMKNIVVRFALLATVVVLGVAPAAHAQITYTNDGTLNDFTEGLTTYATFTNFASGDTSAPYTPTAANVASGIRVFGGTLSGTGLSGTNWIEATFPIPVPTIVVFPNIDHFGSAYDGYQYSIAGSNDGTNWTMLFDAQTVNGTGEPFTLGTFTGTAPWTVNNVLTPGGGPNGTVGYVATFNFGAAYRYYAFGASTEATNAGNTDQELSAVGTSTIVQPLAGNGAANVFLFPFTKYNVIFPADKSISNTTMTISAAILQQSSCNARILNIRMPPAAAVTNPGVACTTFSALDGFSSIFEVLCSAGGAVPTSQQCPTTTGFNPFTGGTHSSEDISNILVYGTGDTIPAVPQMLTASETDPTTWIPFGVGFQSDCCTRGSGGSNYNSYVVSTDFPASTAATFAIPSYNFVGFAPPVASQPPNQALVLNVAKAGSTVPLKWQLFYPNTPASQALGFSGGPVTNLNFSPNGYLGIQTTTFGCPSASSSVVDNTLPPDFQSNTGLINDGNGAYHINWTTTKGMANSCVTLTLSTGDGQSHIANFQFK